MRSDIVPVAIFPDYELSDHTAKRRKLSELQRHPMVLVLSRGGFCPKDRRRHGGLVALHRELEVGYCRLVTISPDHITDRMNIAAELVTTGLSSRTQRVKSKKSSRHRRIHRSSTQSHDSPHDCPRARSCRLRSTTAIGSSAGQLWKISARTYVPLPRNAGRTGTSQRPNSKRRGSKAARNSSIRTAKRTSKLSVNRSRGGIAISYALRRDRPVPFDLGDEPARLRPASGLIGEICVG